MKLDNDTYRNSPLLAKLVRSIITATADGDNMESVFEELTSICKYIATSKEPDQTYAPLHSKSEICNYLAKSKSEEGLFVGLCRSRGTEGILVQMVEHDRYKPMLHCTTTYIPVSTIMIDAMNYKTVKVRAALKMVFDDLTKLFFLELWIKVRIAMKMEANASY